MSFHIHVLKNNAYKFARLNNVALNTEFFDKRVDNVKADEVQKYCGLKRRKQPDKNLKPTLPVFHSHVIFKPLAATQTLPGLYKDHTRNPNAFQMSDVERILANASVPQNKNIIKDDIYATPYRHTFFHQIDYTNLSDSIISQEKLSITVYPTEHIQNILKEMNSIKNEMDRMRESVFQSSSGDINGVIDNKPSPENSSNPDGAPSQHQLNEIKNLAMDEVPDFFERKLRTDCYHANITFENNFFKKKQVTQGIQSYCFQLAIFRSLGRLYYSRPRMEILSMSSHIENGTVVVKWRVSGIPQLRAVQFWKSKSKEPLEIVWHEGISTLYVKDDGLIHLHKLDRVLIDRGPVAKKAKTLAARLAIALGLVPKPSLECSSFWMKKMNTIGK